MGRKEIRKNKEKKQEKVTTIETNDYDQISSLIRIVIILAIIFTGSYIFIGVFVTKEIDFSKMFTNVDSKEEVTINYSEILGSEIFTQKPKEYYVIAYDFEKPEVDVINYVLKETLIITPYYYVNTNSVFNKKVVSSDTSNKYAQNYSELKINGATLIRLTENRNVEYIEGKDNIIKYLKGIKAED